jgi:hypothetical protein
VWDILDGLGRGFAGSCFGSCHEAGQLGVEGDGGISGAVRGGVVRWARRGRGWFGRWGVARRVENLGHLAVVDAIEVLAEGGVGVLVLEGLPVRLLLGTSFLAASTSSLRGRRSEGVVVEVPSWRREVEPRGFSKLVCGAGLIGGSQVGRYVSPRLTSALFMLLRGWRL